MSVSQTLQNNLLSPLVLAFVLGIVAKLLRSDLTLPKDLYASLSVYLLFALGLKGGVELAHAAPGEIFLPALVTLLLGIITPLSAFVVLRRWGGFSNADSAGIAAHYGSVSAVTFIAAQQFCAAVQAPVEGYLPTLLTILESPGIAVALAVGALQTARAARPSTVVVTAGGGGTAALGGGPTLAEEISEELAVGGKKAWEVVREVLTGRTMVLLVGGMLVGFLVRDRGYEPVKPFFETGFKGALTLFLLEMGLIAGARLGDLKKVGLFLLGFGIIMPVIHGTLGVAAAHWAGLGVGGATVLGTMAASASYIAAPPAVRLALPEANPTYSLTAALAVTFPFNLVAGIPLYHAVSTMLA